VLARNKAAVMDALVKVAELDLPKADQPRPSAWWRRPRGPEAARHQGRRQGPDPGRDLRAAGRARVRLGLVVGELVRANNLQAKPSSCRHIEEWQSYEKPAEVVRWYLSDRQRMAEVEAVVIENNVTDFVLARPRSPTRRFDELMTAEIKPTGQVERPVPEESPEPVGRAFFFDRTVFLRRHNGQQDNRHILLKEFHERTGHPSLGMVPMVIEQSGAASAPTTSTRACCASASSSWWAGQRPEANLVVAQLLFLESENPDKDISFYINSPAAA
jgi:hypothetical protein